MSRLTVEKDRLEWGNDPSIAKVNILVLQGKIQVTGTLQSANDLSSSSWRTDISVAPSSSQSRLASCHWLVFLWVCQWSDSKLRSRRFSCKARATSSLWTFRLIFRSLSSFALISIMIPISARVLQAAANSRLLSGFITTCRQCSHVLMFKEKDLHKGLDTRGKID